MPLQYEKYQHDTVGSSSYAGAATRFATPEFLPSAPITQRARSVTPLVLRTPATRSPSRTRSSTANPSRSSTPASTAASTRTPSSAARRGPSPTGTPSTTRSVPTSGKSPKCVVSDVAGGQPVASTRSRRPQPARRWRPCRWMKWPCGISLGNRARSTSRTSRPARASSIAVLAPAQRAPTTTASNTRATADYTSSSSCARSTASSRL